MFLYYGFQFGVPGFDRVDRGRLLETSLFLSLQEECLMSRCFLFLSITLLLFVSVINAQTPAPFQLNEPAVLSKNSLSISVDPRIELLSIVQYLSDYGKLDRSLVTQLEQTYRKDIDERFSKFKSHSVIDFFNRMSKNGFSYDAPPTAMLYLDSDLSLNKEASKYIDPMLWARAGGEIRLTAFIKALRSFAEESEFPEFFKAHKLFYEQILRETAELVQGRDVVKQLEAYYGEKKNGYTVIISPLLGGGSFGPQIEQKEGKNVYCIIGPLKMHDGIPIFGSTGFFNQLQWHEFSHSFVNPLSEKNMPLVGKYSHLFNPLKSRMSAQAYSEWKIVVNESVIRAVTTRLAYQFDGAAAGDRELDYNKSNGFIFTDALAGKLEEYEKRRDRYPTLASFYTQLISIFDGFSESSVAQLLNSYSDRLAINDLHGKAQVLVYEIPEEEGREDAVQYVDAMHSRFFNKLEMMDADKLDDSALRDKLKGSFVIYTTLGSRIFRAATQSLKIQIDGGILTWNGVHAPVSELRIILIGKNPYGAGNIIIYAAGSNLLLKGINSCFHGPRSYHIFQGDALLKEGFYDQQLLPK
jgi:hypothetical protein